MHQKVYASVKFKILTNNTTFSLRPQLTRAEWSKSALKLFCPFNPNNMHLAVFQASHQTGPFWQFRHEFENLGGALSSFLFAFCPHEVLRICNSQRELYDGQHLLPSCHRPKDCKFTPYTGVYLCRANIYWGTSLYVLFEVSSEFTCPNSYTKSSITSQMWQSWIFWGELFGDLLKRGVTLFILTDKSTTYLYST